MLSKYRYQAVRHKGQLTTAVNLPQKRRGASELLSELSPLARLATAHPQLQIWQPQPPQSRTWLAMLAALPWQVPPR